MRFADDEVERGRVVTHFDEARRGLLVQIRKAGFVGGDGHHVQVIQVGRLLRP